MSASACVAFLGLCFEISIDELEDPAEPRKRAAIKAGLKYYAGNFGGLDERYMLFIGAKLAILGPENERAVSLTADELKALLASTTQKLQAAGFTGVPALHLQWEEDV